MPASSTATPWAWPTSASDRVIVHLVRHGQSTWNLERRLQGQRADVPLTDLGRAQAADAAARLEGTAATLVISSDQLRAAETARIIADRLDLPVRFDEALREQALGELEGRSYDDLVPEPVPDTQHISEIRWGGGESVADVHARLTAFVAQLTERSADQPRTEVVIVSHGDTLRILLAVLDGRDHRDVEWVEFGNGEVITRC